MPFDAFLGMLSKMRAMLEDAEAGRVPAFPGARAVKGQIQVAERMAAAMTPEERQSPETLTAIRARDLADRCQLPEAAVRDVLRRFIRTRGWRNRP